VRVHAEESELSELALLFDRSAPLVSESDGVASFVIDEDREDAAHEWIARLRGVLRLELYHLDAEVTLRLANIARVENTENEGPLFPAQMSPNPHICVSRKSTRV
jgi:hypothetical protein